MGLAGYSGSGKTHLGDLLSRRHGFRLLHFGDVVRNVLWAVDPIMGVSEAGKAVRWSALMANYGYQGAKQHPVYGAEVRRIQQALGTEGGRDILGEGVWSDATLRTVDTSQYTVIADVRFVDEVYAIRRAGGIVVRVVRPGVGPLNPHPSENSLDDVPLDLVMANDGAPSGMLEQLGAVYELPAVHRAVL